MIDAVKDNTALQLRFMRFDELPSRTVYALIRMRVGVLVVAAQVPVQHFFQSLGLRAVSAIHTEDGIDHVDMHLQIP